MSSYAQISQQEKLFLRNRHYLFLFTLIFHPSQSWHSVNKGLPVANSLTETDRWKARVDNWLMSKWVFNCLLCVFLSSLELCWNGLVITRAKKKRFKWCVLIKSVHGPGLSHTPLAVCQHVELWGNKDRWIISCAHPHPSVDTHKHTHASSFSVDYINNLVSHSSAPMD